MSTTGVRRVVLLTLGWAELPKSVSVWGDQSGERLKEPVPGILCECDGGWALLDTGYNPALVRDVALHRRFYGRDPAISVVLPGENDPLVEALEQAGVPMEAIAAVAVSHLHYDHAGGLRHFAGLAPVYAQRAELEYGLSPGPGPEENGIFRIDFDDRLIDWRLLSGDSEIAPGVTALLTPGHTPGHQSFIVELDESVGGGGFVFAFDAADLQENIDQELPVGGFINCRPEDTVGPIKRLKDLAREHGFRLVPGHDPVVWPALAEELCNRFAAEP
jgi:N-acyl homoserine lactone hydrolase